MSSFSSSGIQKESMVPCGSLLRDSVVSSCQRTRRHWSEGKVFVNPCSCRCRSKRNTTTCLRRRDSSAHRILAHPEDVFVMDFDGVLCDSAGEVMSAGYACAREVWPEVFRGVTEEGALRDGLKRVRPRLVKGYESMLMARILVERGKQGERDILEASDWATTNGGMVGQMLDAYGCTESELEGLFESWRKKRITNDIDSWISLNPLYPGVKDALDDCQSPYYIASSKSGTRLIPLLNTLLDIGIDIDSPRVFAGLIPPNELKLNVLETVLARPVAQHEGTQLHFIDDRFETLEYICRVASRDVLDRYTMYLASWGYCTEEDVAKARKMEHIRVLELDEFLELVRFGIIMRVNDGCQDTEEETIAQVYNNATARNTNDTKEE